MKKEIRRKFYMAGWLLIAFLLWTAAVQRIDVQPIGPNGSVVGFAAVNRFVHNLTGVHMSLYTWTDWLGLVPIAAAMGFGLLGLAQWRKRKRLLSVDYDLLVLGGFYVIVMAAYAFFEVFVVNHRPVLIDGILEASYPSSTTVLVLCVMPTAMMQLRARVKNKLCKRCVTVVIAGFSGFMVVGRLISGVHWCTDIVGGILLSAGLVLLYHAVVRLKAGERTPGEVNDGRIL